MILPILVCVYVSASAAGYFKGATEHGITTAFKFVVADRESCSEEITRSNSLLLWRILIQAPMPGLSAHRRKPS